MCQICILYLYLYLYLYLNLHFTFIIHELVSHFALQTTDLVDK